MTYFGFLALFLFPPIALLLLATAHDRRQGRRLGPGWHSWPAGLVLLAHVVIAFLYTTPWDNYLVATAVWWYDPALVTGITFGWVPIEEYTFFVLQPILTGLWLLFWARRWREPSGAPARPRRYRGLLVVGLVAWLTAGAVLVTGWGPGTYLALQLIWALPPIMFQLAFGADILRRRARLIWLGLVPPTLYLAVADAIAIGTGTWTINPDQTLGWYLGGVLPFEEFLFFLITNVLLVFGMVLVLAAPSHARLHRWRDRAAGAGSTEPVLDPIGDR